MDLSVTETFFETNVHFSVQMIKPIVLQLVPQEMQSVTHLVITGNFRCDATSSLPSN